MNFAFFAVLRVLCVKIFPEASQTPKFRVVDGKKYNAKNAKDRKERKASRERSGVGSVGPQRGSLLNDLYAGAGFGDSYHNA